MKLLFLSEYAYPHDVSGAEFSMTTLAESLVKSNKIITLSPNLGSQGKLTKNQVVYLKFPFLKKVRPGETLTPLWFNNPFFWLYSAYFIFKSIKKYRINLIHVHGK